MNCPNCQHKYRERAIFCENCGYKLQVLCPNCDTVNRAGAKFCDNCGHNLAGREDAPEGVLSANSLVSKFIPKELAAKLESARSNQALRGERRVMWSKSGKISSPEQGD